jgi:hypothetical protein
MHNPFGSIRAFVAVTAILVFALSAYAGASASPGGTAGPSSAPPTAGPSAPAGPLVTLETLGGECTAGACGGKVVIEVDGRVHSTGDAAAELGVLPEVLLDALVTEIDQADFAAITSRPFTDTCPIAFDGQERIYTFTTPTGTETIDSCKVVVDPAHPLFVAADAAFAAVPAR